MYYDLKFMNADAETDARTKMLIHLIENDLLPASNSASSVHHERPESSNRSNPD